MSSREAPELASDTIARQRAKTRADILATFGGAAARDAIYPDEAGAEHVTAPALRGGTRAAPCRRAARRPVRCRVIALHAPGANVSTDRQERKS